MTTDKDILKFWFEEITGKQRWQKDHDFDGMLRERFSVIHTAASKCELFTWRDTPEGRVAEIIVLDQFSRNMFRDDPRSFAQDSLAMVLAQEAVAQDLHKSLEGEHRAFLLMPYMHSESKIVHEQAMELFKECAPNFLEYEIKHKAIIDRFGRYPHRNKIIGRESTAEEIEFLQQPGSSF